MKYVKLFEQFVGEQFDVKETAQRIMSELDSASQLQAKYYPKEVLSTIEEVLKGYKRLEGKAIEMAAAEIRTSLFDTGNLASDNTDVNYVIMGAMNEAYNEYDINMSYGFYGTIDASSNKKLAKRAEELFDAGIAALQASPYNLSEEEALAVLNSKMGRKAADQIIDGEADSAILGLEQYYGKQLKPELKKVARIAINEDIGRDIKKWIKSNKKDIDAMADEDDWYGIEQKLISDFGVKDEDEMDDLIQTFHFIY